MKVLIADGDPVFRRLMQGYLQKWGYELAVNGAAAGSSPTTSPSG